MGGPFSGEGLVSAMPLDLPSGDVKEKALPTRHRLETEAKELDLCLDMVNLRLNERRLQRATCPVQLVSSPSAVSLASTAASHETSQSGHGRAHRFRTSTSSDGDGPEEAKLPTPPDSTSDSEMFQCLQVEDLRSALASEVRLSTNKAARRAECAQKLEAQVLSFEEMLDEHPLPNGLRETDMEGKLRTAQRRACEAETKIAALTSQVAMLTAALETRDVSLEAAQTRANDCEHQLFETRAQLAIASSRNFVAFMSSLEGATMQRSRHSASLESEVERLRDVESDLVASKREVAEVKSVAAENEARQAAALNEARENNTMLTKEVDRLSASVFRACTSVSSVAGTLEVTTHRSDVEKREALQNTTSNRVLENQFAMDKAKGLLRSLEREMSNSRAPVAISSARPPVSVPEKRIQQIATDHERTETDQESHASTAVLKAEIRDAHARLAETETRLSAAEVERTMLHRMLSHVKTRMIAGGM